MKKILIIINMLLLFLIIAIPTYAFNPPVGSMVLSTSYVDVGLQEHHISFNHDDGSYGINGSPLYGLHSYIANDLEGGVQYITWAIVQDDLKPFELYILNQKVQLSSPIYFIRLDYDYYASETYLTFHARDFSLLRVNTFDEVNSTWELKRLIPNDTILDQLQYSYDTGYDTGYEVGYDTGYEVSYDLGYTKGYSDGLSTDFNFDDVLSWVFMPFDILNKELAFGITFGHIALITIVFGVMGFLFSLKKGKK